MAFDPAPGAKYGLRGIQGDTAILDLDEWSQALVSDIESKMAGFQSGTNAARLALASPLDGLVFRETDTGRVYLGTGTGWVQLGGPRVTRQTHSFTMPDVDTPDGTVVILGAFINRPAAGETVTLVEAVVHCVTVGSTPSVFAVQTDTASHGTLANVTGLTGLQPGTAVVAVPATSPLTLGVSDRTVVKQTTPGNSDGCTVEVVTEHSA